MLVHRLIALALLSPLGLLAAPPGPATQAALPPTPLPGLRTEGPLLTRPDGSSFHYDRAIPTVESLLGYVEGFRAATHSEIERCLKAWDGKGAGGSRAKLFEHGATWEGRTLYHMAISSPANIAKLAAIQSDIASLADPRQLNAEAAQAIVARSPAVAWLAFSIHGDETSGSDAALGLIYHLISSTDPDTQQLLDKLVVIVDPMMNPDGRDRFLKMIAEHRAAQPNVDNQALVHRGYWPWGRTNHYGFDMNRDWLYATQPETRGRIAAGRRWNTQLFVDVHEMSALDTYLFSPAREPYNPYHPDSRVRWMERFAADQAAAFDAKGWVYYTGEWNEGWYPGYSDSWAAFRGAVGMLYEQARYAEDGVRRPSGTIESYREAVQHQATSALTNLSTLATHREEALRAFAAERRQAVSQGMPGVPTVVIDAAAINAGRRQRLRELLDRQGIEVQVTRAAFEAVALDRFGSRASRPFPAGSWLISPRQPESLLAGVMLKLDPKMPATFLETERRELLRRGRSRLYDISAWNLPLLLDIPAYEIDRVPEVGLAPLGSESPVAMTLAPSSVGWIAAGDDDRAPALAARLLERDVQVRVATRATTFGGSRWPRGSIVVTRVDNRAFGGELEAALLEVSRQIGLPLTALASGLGPGDANSDLGSDWFVLLAKPRVAVLSRGGDVNSVGEVWYAVDQWLGIRASLLEVQYLGGTDLRRYNVLIATEGFDKALATHKELIKAWVAGGGTLIAIGDSAGPLAAKEGLLQGVRTLSAALDELDDYRLTVLREALAPTATVDPESLFAPTVPSDLSYPWQNAAELPEAAELKRRDAWNGLFMPAGAAIAARTDDEHWLTAGCGPVLPVLYTGSTVLVSKSPAATPIRFGQLSARPNGAVAPRAAKKPPAAGADKDRPTEPQAGWGLLPSGQQVSLRLSGLVWPEAAVRLANSAYLTQESIGRGQVIAFAANPVFRGMTVATTRLLLNAIVYGPGCGAENPLFP